ncbi:MAG TPA: universal stress protein [Pyrinomonadaceae bacterium]|jgi:nucleotide-binding universal stress UspA family protein|nr:universal stress protein [Pyrinomonadaceae bacterium]
MKLLIAVDSAISTEVLVGAVGVRPWPDGTTAHVLSVVADADVPEEVWREEGYGKRAVRREMERRGEQITARAVERLKEVGIPAEVVVTRGDPRQLIPFFARKWSSDLIFVRAHVRKDLAHWMLGSVARAVVSHAPCTVQIVRDLAEDRAHTLDSGRRVLLATDGSETSAAAAQALAGRPWPEGSEFKIISVEEPWGIKPSRVRHDEQAQEAVRSAERVLASAGLKAILAVVLSGNAKEAILEESQKWAADLIVVGSHGRRGFKRFLLGSVSEAVAMNAHCSVVVVRGPARTSRKARASG